MFEGLEQFGIKESEDINIFEEEKVVQAAIDKTEKAKKENALFLSKVDCPVCKKKSTMPAIKSRYLRILKKDTDLMPIYEGINGLFYGITLCSECGYANLSTGFNKLRPTQKKLIKDNISLVWTKKVYDDYLTLEDAIDLHKLALYNAIVKKSLNSEKSILCLRLSWLCRLNKDKEQETKFQEEALKGLNKAYLQDSDLVGLSSDEVLYLLGELNRRLGNETDALRYFSQVLVCPTAPYSLKEDVRDIRDMMKKEKEEAI